MHELPRDIPSAELLLALAPEELASKLLSLTKQRAEAGRLQHGMLHPSNFIGELAQGGRDAPPYGQHHEEVVLAVTEAWAWLEAQCLIVPAPDTNGRNGWRVLSRRARALQDDADFKTFVGGQLLPKALLHHLIAEKAWLSYMRGEYDTAVFQAMKVVEVEMRMASNLGPELVGVKLARAAFKNGTGPLTDKEAEEGEQEAMGHLFAGALGVFKNPHSHRFVEVNDPADAAAIIMLASHMMRVLSARHIAFMMG